MIETLTSPWIPLLVLVGGAVLVRLMQDNWLAPSVFPALLWSSYMALPLLFTPFPVKSNAAWIIVAIVWSAQVGAFLTEEVASARGSNSWPRQASDSRLANKILRLSQVLALTALVGAVYHAASSLRRFELPFSLGGFFQLGGYLYSLTYEEQEPFLVRILITWGFPAALLGGISCALTTERRKKIQSFTSLFPALVFGATVSARFGLAVTVCCWVAGFLATKSYVSGGKYHLGRKTILSLSLAFIILVCIFVSFDMIRGVEYAGSTEAVVRVKSFMFGYLSAFSDWWKNEDQGRLGLGVYTVAGPFDLLKVKQREHGLYAEVISLQGGDYTNIYTAFRGLIQDFSFPGALVMSFLSGMIAGYAFMRSRSGRTLWIFPLAAYYAFFLWSPMVSLFNYNSVLLAWLFGPLAVFKLSAKPARGNVSTEHSWQAAISETNFHP